MRHQTSWVGEQRFEFLESPLQVCHEHFSRRLSVAMSLIFTSPTANLHGISAVPRFASGFRGFAPVHRAYLRLQPGFVAPVPDIQVV
jgi:hypothetical protein